MTKKLLTNTNTKQSWGSSIYQEDITQDYDHRLSKLETRNCSLESENTSLRDMLNRTQASLDYERNQLTQAVRVIDQYKKRSREYIDLQRKSHQILISPEALHYTMYMDHNQQSNTEQQQHQQQQSQPNTIKSGQHRPPPPPLPTY